LICCESILHKMTEATLSHEVTEAALPTFARSQLQGLITCGEHHPMRKRSDIPGSADQNLRYTAFGRRFELRTVTFGENSVGG